MPVLRTCDDDGISDTSTLTSSSSPGTSAKIRLHIAPGPYRVPLPKRPRKSQNGEPPNLPKRADEDIVVCGIKLTPTVVFDTFWWFAAERKAVDDKRRAAQPWPWTDDAILQKYHFCNTFRVLDRLSQYIIRDVIEKGSQAPEELAFRIILFNLFTKIETYEMLQEEVGPLTWKTYNRSKYAAVLRKAKRQGQTLYTGAFQKPAPKFEHTEGYVNHLILLEVLMDNDTHDKLMNAWHMADIFEYLISFPSMGEFATYQLMLNLSYSKLLNFHRNDFVVPGPGASSGLRKMFGKSIQAGISAISGFEIEVIRWMTDTQENHFNRLGLEPPTLGPDKLSMDVADIEHTLCEVDKYARLAHSHFKGKRTEIRRPFVPRSVLPTNVILPQAWKHPARMIPRVRPEKALVIEKRYSVNRLGAHREGEDGREYLVYWWGYPDSDATWEPESNLLDEAPGAVQDYWNRVNSK